MILDGEHLPEHEIESPALSVADRGVLYGDGIFETLRAYNRTIFALEQHLARLERSAVAFRMQLPPRELLASELERAMAACASQHHVDDIVLRLVITRGVSALGMSLPSAPKLRRFVLAEPTRPPADAVRKRRCVCLGALRFVAGRAASWREVDELRRSRDRGRDGS
ncbi:MAG: aminotransferase class IV [Polyangiaceae bacterium]